MDWLSGIFSYIEKLWQAVYCFFSQFYNQLIDILRGFYFELVSLLLGLLSVIPYPDALANFSYGVIPQAFAWAIYDLGLRDGLLLIAAGATVKITRQLLVMVAK
ncbi:MAG: hypothetical protein HZA11_07825 [Nitrospirae bacterium]|nr:hypothetical protein [Nitrospirota bacterium]